MSKGNMLQDKVAVVTGAGRGAACPPSTGPTSAPLAGTGPEVASVGPRGAV